jgi:hypothetical protein
LEAPFTTHHANLELRFHGFKQPRFQEAVLLLKIIKRNASDVLQLVFFGFILGRDKLITEKMILETVSLNRCFCLLSPSQKVVLTEFARDWGGESLRSEGVGRGSHECPRSQAIDTM